MKNLTVALLGDPISHSLSPIIYPRLGRAAGVSVTYLAYTAKREEAPALMDRLLTEGVDAINLTSPLKTMFGGDNLIVNGNEEVRRYNTDADAFRWGYAKYLVGKKKALIVGSGGVVNGIAGVLMDMGLSVTIAGRQKERPRHLSLYTPYVCIDSIWNLADGMDAVVWAIPVDYEEGPKNLLLSSKTVVIDLRYGKLDVWWPAMQENCHNGLSMVIQNAVLALEKIVGTQHRHKLIEEANVLYHELKGSL